MCLNSCLHVYLHTLIYRTVFVVSIDIINENAQNVSRSVRKNRLIKKNVIASHVFSVFSSHVHASVMKRRAFVLQMANNADSVAKVLALLENARSFIAEKQGNCEVITCASATGGGSFSSLPLCGIYVDEFWEVQQSEGILLRLWETGC